ncbi:hypothetical protein AX14_007904, partial [Amanita brunnescens Koide BX004]
MESSQLEFYSEGSDTEHYPVEKIHPPTLSLEDWEAKAPIRDVEIRNICLPRASSEKIRLFPFKAGMRSSVALAGILSIVLIRREQLVSTVYAGTSTAQQTDCGISAIRAGGISKSEHTFQLIRVLASQAAHKNAKTVLRL